MDIERKGVKETGIRGNKGSVEEWKKERKKEKRRIAGMGDK